MLGLLFAYNLSPIISIQETILQGVISDPKPFALELQENIEEMIHMQNDTFELK